MAACGLLLKPLAEVEVMQVKVGLSVVVSVILCAGLLQN